MIPLSDSSRRPVEYPAVTVWLIAANVVAFGLELLGGDEFVLAWSDANGDLQCAHQQTTPALSRNDWQDDRTVVAFALDAHAPGSSSMVPS
jgi:hypothetical protein